MSDGLTPEFEEPTASAEPAQEFDPYNLTSWLDDGDLLIGFAGMAKVMQPDGSMVAFQVGLGLSEFEALGLYLKAMGELKDSMEMDTYWTED